MKDQPPILTDIPEDFLNRMAGLLGDDYQSFHNALLLPPFAGLRVNTLKLTPENFNNLSPFNLSPVSWCTSGFIITVANETESTLSPGKHPYHSAGLYYLQEPSAMAAAEVLAPQPGESVLDLAAAPGGKATRLAELMDNTGVLVANEIHRKRVWDLIENLERCGMTNTIVTNDTPENLADHFGEYFDRILLDAPCSGEGMFRKSATARQEWNSFMVNSCAIRQSAILEQAARLLKSGGHLAYTTCTFSVEENEGVITSFLSRHPEFDLALIPPAMGFQPAMPEWVGLPSENNIKHAVRIWPHLAHGEGHFIALLVKQGSSNTIDKARKFPIVPNSHLKSRLPKSSRDLLVDFCRANLDVVFDFSRLIQTGSYVYRVPEVSPDLAGLNVIRPGWWLGTINKGRFTPSHSLALGIKTAQAKRNYPLHTGDPKLSSYLKGESISNPGSDGWTMVTVDGFPLGWGKQVHNVIKNFYPHGLRWLP